MDIENQKHFQLTEVSSDPVNNATRIPGQRDPQLTQRAILEAATSEFAEKGYAGASVNEIAAAAKVNKRMLYHYFGKKDDLYLQVLERAYAQLRVAQSQLDLSEMPPREAIERYARFTWDYFVAHPEVLRLFSGENLLRAKYLRHSARIPELRKPVITMLGDVLKRGETEGVFRPRIDPLQFSITIMSLIYFYLSSCQTLSYVYDTDMHSKAKLEARRLYVLDVILAYLSPRSG